MIKKLNNFGKYVPDKYFEDNPLDLNFQYGKDGDKIIVFIRINESNAIFTYQGIELEEYNAIKNKEYYLLKNAKGNSVSSFPTLFFEKSSLIDNKIDKTSKSWGKLIKIIENDSKIDNSLKNLLDLMVNTDFNDEIDINDNFILSLKINDEYIGQSKYFENIRKDSKESIYNIFFSKYNTVSKAYQKSCYICNNKTEVWGFVDLIDFKFYSSNENSVIAGGFSKENSWKNYPVCPNCTEKLFSYKSLLEKYLSFRFYGFSYYLIPEIIFDNENNKEITTILTNDKYGIMNLKSLSSLMETEDDIFDLLKDDSNMINFNLFFYEKNNSEFKIIMSIDDVFPSRFRRIHDIKQIIENQLIFKNIEFKKGEKEDLFFSFGIIKHFFLSSKKEGDFSKYFLEIVRSVFVGIKIDYEFVISRVSEKIRSDFVNDYSLYKDVLYAMMLIKFINLLGLWNKKEKKYEKELKMDSNYETFFEENSDFFDTNTKKAIFLEGVLCQFLLDIQYRDRGATPFKSRLNGLKIDEQIIKRLLPEMINKLEEYGENYYRDLESMISEYLLKSTFTLTNDEISFYFVMGMNLAKKFKLNKKEDTNNGNN